MTTLAELKPLLPILRYASDAISYNSCNDYTIDNTPEAQALWRKIHEWSDPTDQDEWTLVDLEAKPHINFTDFVAIDYIIHLIEEAQL